jgi:mannose/fructose-specific phosphotransferase system component IIA
MSDATPARGVVVAHGELARGLVGAARQIAGGVADALTPISNQGKTPDILRAEIDAIAGDDPVVVFVDLHSGSCGVAALSCCRDRVRRVVVAGVNLAMLLDFLFHRELPLEELAARLVSTGRAGIASPAAR